MIRELSEILHSENQFVSNLSKLVAIDWTSQTRCLDIRSKGKSLAIDCRKDLASTSRDRQRLEARGRYGVTCLGGGFRRTRGVRRPRAMPLDLTVEHFAVLGQRQVVRAQLVLLL